MQEFAAASETPHVTVAQTARELKQDRSDLWLWTGRGRREAHVKPSHLVNLKLAVATGTPSKAVENVRLFRNLKATAHLRTGYGFETPLGTRAHIATTEVDLEGRMFSGGSLGDDLDILVRWLAHPDDTAKLATMRQCGVKLTILTGAHPYAELLCRNILSDGWDRITEYRQVLETPLGQVQNRPWGLRQTAAIQHPAVIELPLFECLAALWRDSAERIGAASTPSPSGFLSPAGGNPGNENAALAGAASTRVQDHGSAIPAGHAPEYKCESENSQALLSRGPGPSNRKRKGLFDEPKSHATAGPGG